MTTTPTIRPVSLPTPAPTGSTDAKPRRNDGQWALGDRAPLNATEEMKAADDGLNVRHRIETVYARNGFDSIAPDDLRGRFRWWGLYTQRRPGIDGGKTAQLEPEELEDSHFMLRVRVDGGILTTEQLRVIGAVSTEFARDTADLTDRQNVQLHWVRIEDVPEIWRRLEAVGLSTTQACGDVPRVILGSPVAGVAADELVDPTPAIRAIADRYLGTPEFSNLPRKYKTAITGHPSLDVAHEINDVAFVAVRHPQLGVGYDLWVGGGLSTNPRLAERLGAWVAPADVPEVWAGVTSVFRDYGYRRLRHRARLKFLVAAWGVERFREVLETEYLHRRLPDGPPPPAATAPGDHIGVHRQHDGRFFVGVSPTVGRVSGTVLTRVAEVAEAFGSRRVRTTPHQKLLVLDIEEPDVPAVVAELGELGLSARPGPLRRSTIACTGLEYCKLAIVETKARAAAVVRELETRLAGLDSCPPISLHLNGCPNSCARIQTADIGLKGQLVTDDDGSQVEGFQVHLGGGLAATDRDEPGLGRKVRGLKVTADELPDFVERLVRSFLARREGDESFSAWVQRAPEEDLR